jgi:cytochrome c553
LETYASSSDSETEGPAPPNTTSSNQLAQSGATQVSKSSAEISTTQQQSTQCAGTTLEEQQGVRPEEDPPNGALAVAPSSSSANQAEIPHIDDRQDSAQPDHETEDSDDGWAPETSDPEYLESLKLTELRSRSPPKENRPDSDRAKADRKRAIREAEEEVDMPGDEIAWYLRIIKPMVRRGELHSQTPDEEEAAADATCGKCHAIDTDQAWIQCEDPSCGSVWYHETCLTKIESESIKINGTSPTYFLAID